MTTWYIIFIIMKIIAIAGIFYMALSALCLVPDELSWPDQSFYWLLSHFARKPVFEISGMVQDKPGCTATGDG